MLRIFLPNAESSCPETIRQWCEKFGPDYARKLKRREGRLGDHWQFDEVFIRINGQQQYLWRAVDQDGDVIDRFSGIVIGARQSDSFEGYCVVRAPNHYGSLPTS